MDTYRSLDPEETIGTVSRLRQRIEERFPGSGLGNVCNELLAIARENTERAEWITRPLIGLRIFIGAIIVVSLLGLVYSVSLMEVSWKTPSFGELVQVSEAGLNAIVIIGAAVFFLITVETRIKRSRALTALHELRAIAHVIDMHQLTKDPNKLGRRVVLTESSPRPAMSSFQLSRYLDYCSEMLSLTGKVAALYAQGFRDPVVLDAVNELEGLTTGLSRKIWQKIMLLNQWRDGAAD